jgi:hypothetical protein
MEDACNKEGAMDETFRMLGREHQADLERDAQRHRLAAQAARAPKVRDVRRPTTRRARLAFFLRLKEV